MENQPESSRTIAVHAIIHGQVQGVGFRAAVRHHAMQLGLLGTTRNLQDGTVEIHVQGPKEKVSELFRELHKEFDAGYISSILQEETAANKSYDGFRIIP